MKLEKMTDGRYITLNDFTTKEIKGFIQKYNNALKIKGYSKIYKKADMIALIEKHPLVRVSGNEVGVSFSIKGQEIPNMEMRYKFTPKKKTKAQILRDRALIKRMNKKEAKEKKEKEKKEAKEKKEIAKKEKAPPKPKKEKASAKPKEAPKPKKLLKYEIAYAEGKPKNASQRALIAKMTDIRRAEVLQMLGLKKPKAKKPFITGDEVKASIKQKREIAKKEKAPPKEVVKKAPIAEIKKRIRDAKTQEELTNSMKGLLFLSYTEKQQAEITRVLKKKENKLFQQAPKAKTPPKNKKLDDEFFEEAKISIEFAQSRDELIDTRDFYMDTNRFNNQQNNILMKLAEKIKKKLEKEEKAKAKAKAKKEKAPPKPKKEPKKIKAKVVRKKFTAKQLEAQKKFGDAQKAKAKKKKEVSVSFD